MKNKQEVEKFCKEHNLTEEQFYGRKKIEGDLDLRDLTSIPEGFNPTVGGYLYLSSLTSIQEGFNPAVGGSLWLDSLTSIPEGFNPTVGGNLDLSGLTSIPEGFNPTVGGNLDLSGLTSIPEGFNPTVGRGLDLRSLTSIPEDFNPTVGGWLWLESLTSIPEGFNPTVGGNLNLSSLTSIPEGFNPTVGGSLWLDSLTSIPEGFNPTVGSCLLLNGLTSIPEGFNPIVGGDLDLRGLTSIPEGFNPIVGGYTFYMTGDVSPKNKPVYPLTWQDGKYLLVDYILCEVLNHKGNVYRIKIVGKKEESYLVTDGASWAHGETLEEAKDDLKYKVQPRDLSDYKDVTVDTAFSFEEAVAFYRAVTGACSLGVKNFVESKGLYTDKSYTVGEMLELVEGEYGEEKFREFLTEKAGNNDK